MGSWSGGCSPKPRGSVALDEDGRRKQAEKKAIEQHVDTQVLLLAGISPASNELARPLW